MINQMLVMLVGLGLGAWGHLLIHDLFGAADAWDRADANFPTALRTAPSSAGWMLLGMGSLLVLVSALG